MRLCITARRLGLRGRWREHLEARLRLVLGPWASRIRQAAVSIEDISGCESGLDRRCSIEATLIPSGRVAVHALGTDIDSALQGAGRRLVRRVKADFERRSVRRALQPEGFRKSAAVRSGVRVV